MCIMVLLFELKTGCTWLCNARLKYINRTSNVGVYTMVLFLQLLGLGISSDYQMSARVEAVRLANLDSHLDLIGQFLSNNVYTMVCESCLKTCQLLSFHPMLFFNSALDFFILMSCLQYMLLIEDKCHHPKKKKIKREVADI